MIGYMHKNLPLFFPLVNMDKADLFQSLLLHDPVQPFQNGKCQKR
jgi:hypothetical protein